MYELIQVAENSYYIQSPAKIGLFKLNDTDVCLIDSGNDKDAGRKIRQILDAHQWHLTAIYNTHSNADHIGGNKYLQGQTAAHGGGCRPHARNRLLPAIFSWEQAFFLLLLEKACGHPKRSGREKRPLQQIPDSGSGQRLRGFLPSGRSSSLHRK